MEHLQECLGIILKHNNYGFTLEHLEESIISINDDDVLTLVVEGDRSLNEYVITIEYTTCNEMSITMKWLNRYLEYENATTYIEL